ncbi:MAG: O-antigen ligase family protein [Planctomycetota bacterium]
MSESNNGSGGPPAELSFAAVIRRGSVFLLALSAAMLPLVSSEHLFLRLLCLLLGIAGAFFWLLQAIFERQVEVPWGWHVTGGALVLIAGVVSACLSDCPQEAILTLLTWLGYASAFVLAVWAGRNERVRRGLLCVLCAAAVPVAVLATLQYVYLLDKTHADLRAGRLEDELKGRFSAKELESLERRLENKRVFATFALPNSLAGYLLILLPAAAVLLAVAKRRGARWIIGGCAALLLLAFFFTFSKGGWLVGVVLLALFLILRGRGWLRRRWGVALGIAAAIAVVLVAAVVLSPVLRTRLDKMSKELGGSARVRMEYWAAGLSMWRGAPALGVGLGNFKNHYMMHKAAAAEEVKHAHNDYVEILADCGPAALAGYLLFWLMLVAGSIRGAEARAAPAARPPPPFLLACAGALGVLAAGFFGQLLTVFDQPVLNFLFICALAALCWAAYRAFSAAASDASPAPLALGLLLGVAGFLLHSLVDLDLYVEGVAYTAFVVAGLVAAPWARMKALQVEGARQVAVTIAATVAGLFIFYVASRICEAEVSRVRGLALARLSSQRAATSDAHVLLMAACRANPFDHRAFAALAASLERSRTPAGLEAAISARRRAVRLAPLHADYRVQLARLFDYVAPRHPGLLKPHIDEYRKAARAELPPGAVPDRFLPALIEMSRAVDRAPTKPQYRARYGEGLLSARLKAEAAKQLQKALDLNSEMIRAGAPERQWLSKEQERQVQDLLKKLGLTGAKNAAIIP